MNGTPASSAGTGGAAMREGPAPARGQRFKARLRELATLALAPVARTLLGLGLKADHVTILGLLFSIAAGYAFFSGGFRVGAALAAASGLCDMLDGQLARARGTTSRFGAFLDSTLDRLADAALLTGLAGFYAVTAPAGAGAPFGSPLAVALVAMLALLGSLLVSYTRARAEGLGLECRVGVFERPERLVLLIGAACFGVGPLMPWALAILAILSFATAAQRVAHVYRKTRGAGRDEADAPNGS